MAPLLIVFGSRPACLLEGKRDLRVSLRLPVVYVVVTFLQTHTCEHGSLKTGEGKINGRVEVTGIRGRRHKQLHGNLKNGSVR
jgi:hypothetical protein